MQTPIEEVAQIFLTKVKVIETKSLSTLELLILFRNIEKNIE